MAAFPDDAHVEVRFKIGFSTPLQIQMIPADQPAEPSILGIFAVDYNNVRFKGENMATQIKSGTYLTVSVEWKDKGGNAVPVDGPTTWESSDPSIATVEVSTGNPLIANVKSVGPIGTVKIGASADADLGQGVRTVSCSLDVEVIKGDAVMGEITAAPQTPGQGVPQSGQKAQPPSGQQKPAGPPQPATTTGGTPPKR